MRVQQRRRKLEWHLWKEAHLVSGDGVGWLLRVHLRLHSRVGQWQQQRISSHHSRPMVGADKQCQRMRGVVGLEYKPARLSGAACLAHTST